MPQGLGAPTRIDERQVAEAVRRATAILNREAGANPYAVHEDLQEVMGRYVGIVRSAEDLKVALKELERLKADASGVKAAGASQYNAAWHEALDLRSVELVLVHGERGAQQRRDEIQPGLDRHDEAGL